MSAFGGRIISMYLGGIYLPMEELFVQQQERNYAPTPLLLVGLSKRIRGGRSPPQNEKASGERPVQAAPRRQFFCFCAFTGRPSEWPVRPSGRADGSRSLQRSHRRGARRSPPRSPRPCVRVACAPVQRGQPLLFPLYAHFFGGVVAVHSARILGRCNGCSRRSDCACPVHSFHALLQIIRNPG